MLYSDLSLKSDSQLLDSANELANINLDKNLFYKLYASVYSENLSDVT